LWVLGYAVALSVEQFREGARELEELTSRVDGARVERALRTDLEGAPA
jgi:hypothetical protein